MPDQPLREPEGQPPSGEKTREMMTSDIPTELRGERFVTLTVGQDVDMEQSHPTEANPEARG